MDMELKEEKAVDFDEPVEGGSGDAKPRQKRLTKKRSSNDEWMKLGYKKPDYGKDRDKEIRLRNTAIKGVTQLFNAVAQRQSLIDAKMEELEKTKGRHRKNEIIEELKSNDFHSSLYRQPKAEELAEPKEELGGEASDDD